GRCGAARPRSGRAGRGMTTGSATLAGSLTGVGWSAACTLRSTGRPRGAARMSVYSGARRDEKVCGGILRHRRRGCMLRSGGLAPRSIAARHLLPAGVAAARPSAKAIKEFHCCNALDREKERLLQRHRCLLGARTRPPDPLDFATYAALKPYDD